MAIPAKRQRRDCCALNLARLQPNEVLGSRRSNTIEMMSAAFSYPQTTQTPLILLVWTGQRCHERQQSSH